MIELVISILILTILSLFSIPVFLTLINQAKLTYAKAKLDNYYKSCLSKISISDTKSVIPGVSFFNNKEGEVINCRDKLKASINNHCCIDIDMISGVKNNNEGWPSSYYSCDEASCLAEKPTQSEKTEYRINITTLDSTGNTSQENLKVSVDDNIQWCMTLKFGNLKIQICLNPPSIEFI